MQQSSQHAYGTDGEPGSGMAITGFVLSLLSWLCLSILGSIPGLILGIVALVRANEVATHALRTVLEGRCAPPRHWRAAAGPSPHAPPLPGPSQHDGPPRTPTTQHPLLPPRRPRLTGL